MDRFRTILVGVDLSSGDRFVDESELGPASRTALERASWLAQRNAAPVHVVSTVEVDAWAGDLILRTRARGEPSLLDQAEARMAQIVLPLRDAGVTVTHDVTVGRPAEALLADVTKHGHALVVVGKRERGAVARNVLGRPALALLRHCPVPVWIARRHKEHARKVVLAPIGLGDLAPRILEMANALALAFGAELHVLHVVDIAASEVLRAGAADEAAVLQFRRERRENAEREVPRFVAETLGADAAVRTHLVDGEVHEVILDHAARLEADIVVMGTVVRSGLRALLLGSSAEKVLPQLATELVVVKPPAQR